jgi:NDP-sugar pyrophosphorylase family protein
MLEIGGSTILTMLIEAIQPYAKRIHVVVGYREELIIQHIARQHPEVIIVRNPDFRTTNTAESMAMGARGSTGKVLFLDGDLIIDPKSMMDFENLAKVKDILIGVTQHQSENAVFAHIKSDIHGSNTISRFSREDYNSLEWANVFCGPADILDGAKKYVFEALEGHLPAPAFILNLCEIDTISDLDNAKKFFMQLTSARCLSPSCTEQENSQ